VDWPLELIVVPVSDVDRAKTFYLEQAGLNLDVDHRGGEDFRVVQLTPPGLACSIALPPTGVRLDLGRLRLRAASRPRPRPAGGALIVLPGHRPALTVFQIPRELTNHDELHVLQNREVYLLEAQACHNRS
jgi:hypothetical protein